MWALLLATVGAGATSVAGGSWRWLENNEPRFGVLSDRLISLDGRIVLLERGLGDLRMLYEKQHGELKGEMKDEMASLRLTLGTKVDNSARIDMLNTINDRLNQLDRHMEAIDNRINVLIDRMSGGTYPKGGRLGSTE